jgi:AAA domain-containing protein
MVVPYPYPALQPQVRIEAGMMRVAEKRTLDAHRLGGFIGFTGHQGIGKTTTAEWMVERINAAYDPNNSRAFRAAYFTCPKTSGWSKQEMLEMKRGVRLLYVNVLGPLDNGFYRSSRLPDEIAEQVVIGYEKNGIQLVFADEAGNLSLNAIRGMVIVSDKAKHRGWDLTIVLLGMDDLPRKLEILPQIRRRVNDLIYFKPYTLAETKKLLAALHPYFGTLEDKNKSHRHQLETIHEKYEGLPGYLTQFALRFSIYFREEPGADPMTLIQAAFLQPETDWDRAKADSDTGYTADLKKLLNTNDGKEADS